MYQLSNLHFRSRRRKVTTLNATIVNATKNTTINITALNKGE